MMRNTTPFWRSLFIIIGLAAFNNIGFAQDYNVTLPQQCNTVTGGTEVMNFLATPVSANSDATLTILYQGDLDISGTEILNFIGENSTPLGQTVSIAQCTGIGTFTTTIPMATIQTWAADGQIDITAQSTTSVNALGNCVNGQTVSFCVTGTLSYGVSTAPNDMGIASLDTPGTFFCSGNYDIYVTSQNYGTNLVANHTINWSWNGVPETPININTPLDTINGSGQNTIQVMLGNKTISGPNTLKVWTSNPNNAADTVNMNDTLEIVLTPSIQAPTTLSAGNLGPVGADLSWTEIGSSTQWNVQVGPTGFTLGSGTNYFTGNNPFSLSGLTPNTIYDFYVRSICSGGDTSAWSGPATFTTTCAVYGNPYLESFDGPSWTLTFPLQIDPCWNRNPTTGYVWQAEDLNTGSLNTGPLTDVSGVGKYVYAEASSGALGTTSTLTSPPIDISNLTAPQVEFYYHMYGASIGTLDVEVSDGVNWVNIFTISGQQQTSSAAPWIPVNIPFTTADDTVQFRIIATRGASFDGDICIDEFRVFQPIPNDLSAIALGSLTSGCGLTSTETVSVDLVNLGTATFNSGFSFPVSADVNGTVTTENATLSAAFAPGDTFSYTFTTPFDLSTFGAYNFKLYASLPGDTANTNDTLYQTITNIPIINNYPYSQNFDGGPAGWTSGGTSSTWALGAPAGSVINSASSSPNAWVTNLTGQYNNGEASFVTGPCFGFDSLIAPELQVDVWWESEFSWDGMQVQQSLDGGATWTKVSFFGDPNSTNWYTDNTINGLQSGFGDGDGWTGRLGTGPTGGSNGWLTATADLSSIAGQNDVLFRMAFGSDGSVQGEGVAFDNFRIIETALPFNLELLSVPSPQSGCGLSSTDTVRIEYANVGLNPIPAGDTLNFTYVVNGTPVNENLILASTLLPNDTAFYTFNTTVNLSTPATYAFDVIASFSLDQNPLNDTISFDIVSIPVISSYPYYEDFESGNGGWTSGGTNNSWAYGTPAGGTINSASSGSNAWVTNLTSNYNNSEESFVLGPCFDFTNLVLPLIKLDVWWDSEQSWDGAQVQASTNAGATWQTIGAFGDPFNWYTDNTVNGLQSFVGNGDGWTNSGGFPSSGSLGWLTAQNDLSSFAGNSGVLMRVVFGSDGSVNTGFDGFAFDNFHILESPTNDIAVDSLFGLQSGCGYTANTQITMRVTNRGIAPQSNIPVFYTVNGTASPTETIPGPINPGGSLVYNFSNTADLSNPQTYTIVGRAALATDEDTTNDASNAKIVAALFTPVVDSVLNGETCESGPVTLTAFTTGDTDRWFSVPVGGTALGTGSSYTIPNVTQDDTLWVETVASSTGCNSATASGRVPVYAFHSTTPIINFTSALAGNQTVNFTSTLSPNVDSVLWSFGDGNFSTQANPQHQYAQSQSYLVTLTAYSGSCVADTTKAVFVPVGLSDNAYTNLSVYPNPSTGNFKITADNISDEVEITIVSMTGTTVYRERAEASKNGLNHDVRIDNISQGTYLLTIRNDKMVINGRIVVE